MISEVHTRFSAPVSKRHITPNTPHVYTTTNSGAGRLGETATVAEDRCVGRRFPGTTQLPRTGTANSRDKDAAQRDFVSPPGEVDVNAQRAWPLFAASTLLMRVWPREWSWDLSDLIAVVAAVVARRPPTGAGFIGFDWV